MFHRHPPAAPSGTAGSAGGTRAAHAAGAPAVSLSPPAPGDIGWVVARHGALYAQEYGWDWRFEAMVARICADFVERFDGEREACWIARRSGGAGEPPGADERLGCVFLVQARSDDSGEVIPGVAQLRMLIVEPAARGLGLGRQLVAACEDFARRRGYRQMRLWTNQVLDAARHIYQSRGWQLVRSESHESFGAALVGEFWELDLKP
ncbi:MAG: GNAT family N-acetyltransferase [Rubrivivax sp.]|nr:GNAT family N-acetyltransferase [Rubrivivax sp.]